MKRQKIIAAFCIWGFILLGVSPGWAKVLEVPGQFKSISSALEAAISGDEVLVSPGTYQENVALKKGVVLRSQGSNEERANFTAASRTIIQSAGTAKQIVMGAEGAVLDGFTLQDTEKRFNTLGQGYGVLIEGTTATVTNCIIAHLPYDGIGIKGPTLNGTSIMKNNRIYENKGDGIECEMGAKAQLEACEIYLNGGSGIHNAASRLNIKHNIIYQNGVDGVMNSGGAEPVILENEIYQNGLNGIGLQQSSKGRVVSNQIWGNQQAGIGMRGKAECIILNNTIFRNLIGIGLMDIKQATIELNKITANHMVGIGLLRCQGGRVILRKNDLRGNRMLPLSPNRGCELIEEGNQKW